MRIASCTHAEAVYTVQNSQLAARAHKLIAKHTLVPPIGTSTAVLAAATHIEARAFPVVDGESGVVRRLERLRRHADN